MDIVRLAQTNSRYHGRPERIVWAQREYTPEEMTAVENIRLIAQKITASGECPWAYMRDSYVEEYPEWDHAVEILGIERALIILRA